MAWDSALLGGLKSGDIRYGLIDKGNNWNGDTNPIATSDNPITLPQFTPMIRAKALVDEIMDSAGYTYTSTYFGTNDFQAMYVPCWNGASSIIGEDVDNEDLRAALGSPQTIAGGASGNLNYSDAASGGSDPGGNWNNSTDTYTAPFSGIFKIRVIYSFSFSGASGATLGLMRLQINNSAVQTKTILDDELTSPNNRLHEFDSVYLASGDTAQIVTGKLNE